MLSLPIALSALVAVPTVTLEDVEFLGFSADERLAAWRLVVTEPVGPRELQYPLVQVVRLSDLDPIAEFRAGAARVLSTGKVLPPRKCPSARWRQAKGLNAWKKLAARERFGLLPGSDVTEATRVSVERGYLAHRGGGLRFESAEGLSIVLKAGLANGETLRLGRFGHARAVSAQIRVYTSPSGHQVAVECRLRLADGTKRAEPMLRRLPTFPLRARPQTGPLDSDQVRVIYGEDTWGLGVKSRPKG